VNERNLPLNTFPFISGVLKFFDKNWSNILPLNLIQEVEITKIEFWKSNLKRTGAEYEVLKTIKF